MIATNAKSKSKPGARHRTEGVADATSVDLVCTVKAVACIEAATLCKKTVPAFGAQETN